MSDEEPMFPMSESPEPFRREHEQSFSLDTYSPAEYKAYLSEPLENYSGSSREFLNSQKTDDISKFRASYPKISDSEDPVLSNRYKTGLSGSRFGVITDQMGSAPATGVTKRDPWRDMLRNAEERHKGPLKREHDTSPFRADIRSYHNTGKIAEAAATEYNDYKKSIPKIDKETRLASPDLYLQANASGSYQTREQWGESALSASEPRDRAAEALLGRLNVRDKYPGYDSFEAYRGHKKQIKERQTSLEVMNADINASELASQSPYQER